MFDQGNLKQSIMDSAKSLVDANVIVGQPIVAGDTTVVPVFKASVGIAAGGNSHQEGLSGGGAGLSVSPVTFIVISNGNVRLLSAGENTSLERLIESAPGWIERILNMIKPASDEDSPRE